MWGSAGRAFLLALLALLAVRAWGPLRFARLRAEPEPFRGPSGWDSSGALHVHSALSDGTGGRQEIADAARLAGCAFVMLADHHRVQRPIPRWDGMVGGVTMIGGLEIDTDRGHLLGLGMADVPYHPGPEAEDAAREIARLGGVPLAAHPDAREDGWNAPLPRAVAGMEVLNLASQWYAADAGRQLSALSAYPFDRIYPMLGLLRAPVELRELWARLPADQSAAVAGADAHGHVLLRERYRLPLPGYAAQLGVTRTHVMTEAPLGSDYRRNRELLLGALRAGRSFAALDGLAAARGFDFWAESGGRRYPLGSRLSPTAPARLHALNPLPGRAELRLLRDGSVLAASRKNRLSAAAAGPGRYWAEAHLQAAPLVAGVPWILSSAIVIAPPVQAPPPAPTALADALELELERFQPEHDQRSWISPEVLEQTDAGERRLRMEFHLAAADPVQPEMWCALALRQAHSFATKGDGRLLLRTWATTRLRITLQVRTHAPNGEREWERNFFSDHQPRTVVVPLRELRPVQNQAGKLDAIEVSGLFLIVDEGTTRGGTSATVWFDRIALGQAPGGARAAQPLD